MKKMRLKDFNAFFVVLSCELSELHTIYEKNQFILKMCISYRSESFISNEIENEFLEEENVRDPWPLHQEFNGNIFACGACFYPIVKASDIVATFKNDAAVAPMNKLVSTIQCWQRAFVRSVLMFYAIVC